MIRISAWILGAVCFFAPLGAHADVHGLLVGEKLFIKVTQILEPGQTVEESSVRFEKCLVEEPESCELIGAGEYRVSDIRAGFDELSRRAAHTGKLTGVEILLTVLASAGAGFIGLEGGAAIGGALGRACTGNYCGLEAAGIGGVVGAAVAATGTAILMVKLFEKKNRKKKALLEAEARALRDDVVLDQPVQLDANIETFATELGDALLALRLPSR